MPSDKDQRDDGLAADRPAEDKTTQTLLEARRSFSLAPGDVLAERYRIIRFIARGGMGEVYEVEDLTLRGHLALKTIRPDIAANPLSVERFKREINVARKITHPNVSRIYDVGVHRGASETMFLTMEFLAGETLGARLARAGKMSESDALPLADQIAAGLAAAHDAGIIHRDFKSANVMLVPAGQGVRAVVTDFGLARPAASQEGMLTISEVGVVMGTPAYMAPEQVAGTRLTPAADIYSFGVVLYEMVTGKRPFEADTPFSAAVKRLTEAPVPPRRFVPTLDPAWNAAILRCLERDPAARFATATDVTRALRSTETPTTVRMPAPRSALASPAIKRAGVIAGVGVMAAIVVLGILSLRESRPQVVSPVAASNRTAPVVLRRAMAVLGLQNNSGRTDAAWLSTAISEMLSTELAAGGKSRIAPGEDVARVKADLKLGQSDGLSAENLQRVRKSLGVQSVVLGSYTLVGEPGSRLLRIDVRVVDTNSGNILASAATSGTEAQLFDLVSRVGGGLRQKLGLGDLSPTQAVEVQASIPSKPEAVRLFTEGLAKLRLLDARAARDLLARAVSADKKHPLIYSSLSAAYAELGDDAQATDAARRAVALSGNLGREQRLQIEARLHEAGKDWDKAVEVERSLWESFPDNIEYGLNLANAQISAGRTKEALVTVEALRKLPLPVSADGRIDLAESRASQEFGDFAKQKTFAAAAAAKGRTVGSGLLVARARMLEATALITLGDISGATSAIDEARSLFAATGDRGAVARALELTATTVRARGDIDGQRRLLEQALAIHREIGDRSSIARVLLNLGGVLLHQGRPADAQTFFDESLATFKRIGAKFPAAVALNDIGAMLFNRGDLVGAQKRYEEGLTLFSELGEKTGTATTLTNIGEVLTCRGNLHQAREMHEDALAINRAIGDKSGIAYDLFRLGEIFVVQGQFVAARERFQEALTIQSQIGDTIGAADTRVALAGLAIEQGNPADAEKTAREAEEILRTEGATERSVLGLAAVADSLLAQGKQKEAYDTAMRAWKNAADSEDRRIRFTVAVSMARARAASKKPDDVEAALKFLETMRAEASRSLFVVSELEARLAAGEIEIAAGRLEGKRRLATLEKDAKTRGFERIARRAAAGAA